MANPKNYTKKKAPNSGIFDVDAGTYLAKIVLSFWSFVIFTAFIANLLLSGKSQGKNSYSSYSSCSHRELSSRQRFSQ